MRTRGLQTKDREGRAVRALVLGIEKMRITLKQLLLVTIGAIVFAPFAVGAQSVTIDFENLPAMWFLDSVVPESAKLSNQLISTYGVVFSSESSSPYVAVVELGPGHAPSGIKGIGGVADGGLLSYSTPLRMEFFLPSLPSVEATTDYVCISADNHYFGSGAVTLQAYDLGGALIATSSQIDDHTNLVLCVSKQGIHSVRISSETGTVAFDDLTLNPLDALRANWFSLAGGGDISTGGVYTARATIGEPTVGTSQGGGYSAAEGFWQIFAASQPRLEVAYAAGMITVFWRKPATDFLLDQTPTLSGPVIPWSQVAFPYQTDATRIYVTVPAPSGNRFYRLRHP